MKPIPTQYKYAEELIYDLGKLGEKLYPFITELGESLEVECGDCIITVEGRYEKENRRNN